MPREVPFTAAFLGVKLLDIGLTTTYFFVIGLAAAKVFDLVYGKFKRDDYKKMNKGVLFLDIVFHMFLVGITAYALRNIIGLIPFPLEGVAGFEHKRLKELSGGTALSLILLFFQDNLRDKITYFADSVFGIRPDETKKSADIDPPDADDDAAAAMH